MSAVSHSLYKQLTHVVGYGGNDEALKEYVNSQIQCSFSTMIAILCSDDKPLVRKCMCLFIYRL